MTLIPAEFRIAAVCAIAAVALTGLPAPLPAQPIDLDVHPGFSMSSLRPQGFNPRVSGLAFLPGGELLVTTWENFGPTSGNAHVLKNVTTGQASQVQVSSFATGLNEPLGVTVSDGKVYVIDKDSLLQLVDADEDLRAEARKRIASGWQRNPTDNSNKDLQFALGLVRAPAPDNRFIAGLATRWVGSGLANSSADRGCIIGMELDRTDYDVIACGIRTPNGVVIGPEDGIFVTDNQGNYVPASKLVHVKQGRFFGVKKSQPSPFESAPETPPVVWMPHGPGVDNVSISPTQPVFLTEGVFTGQMIVGDNVLGSLKRISLEKVGGEWQGAVYRFSGGLQAGANRIVTGPDGALYIGGIGAGDRWGGWEWAGQRYGLQRLEETGDPFFDVVAVRSLGNNSFAIDFTEPVMAAAASNFTAQQWSYSPGADYGCCKNNTQNLSVQSASLNAEGTTATVQINGLARRNVVYIKLSGIQSKSGRPLWTDRFWYTLNEFGPGTPVPVSNQIRSRTPEAWKLHTALAAPGRPALEWHAELRPERVELLALDGRVLESAAPRGDRWTAARGYTAGTYFVRLTAAGRHAVRKVVVP